MSQRTFGWMTAALALSVAVVAQVAAQAPVRVGGDIKEPKRLNNVRPVYPAIAEQAGIQGIVIVEAVIAPDGRVQSTKLLRSIPLLDSAALDAVSQWEYEPTLLNGVPVPVIMTVTVSFTLDKPAAEGQAAPAQIPQTRQIAALLEYARTMSDRGMLAETERALQRALELVKQERARGGDQPAALTETKAPIRVGGDVTQPSLLKYVAPVYQSGQPQSITIAEIIVGADGRVTEVKIIRSAGASIDPAVVAALRQWTYTPTILNGVAVPVIMTVTVR